MSFPVELLQHSTRQLRADARTIVGFLPRRVRRHRSSRMARWVHYALLLLLVAVVLPVMFASPSMADSGSAGSMFFDWLSDKDSHGHTPAAYILRVHQGGVTSPIVAMGAFLLGRFWDVYRLMVMAIAWALDFTLQFKSLGLIRGPATVVGNVLQETIGNLGMIGAAVTVSTAISLVWIARGRYAAGYGEMLVSITIAALIGTAAANPVALITGNDGAIVKSQQMGSAITSNMIAKSEHKPPPKSGDPEKQVQSAATAKVLDTFIRTPQQILNYGMLFDRKGVSKDCQKAYDDSLHGSMKPIMAKCPKVAKDTVAHPDRSLVGAVVIFPAACLLGLFVFVLLVVTFAMTALAGWEAAKFGWQMVKAIFPGGSRDGLFTSMCTMAIACACLLGSVIGIGVFVLAINAVFDQTRGQNIVAIYLVIDMVEIVAIVGLITMGLRAHKHGKKLGSKVSRALSPRPSAMPSGRSAGATALAGARTGASMMRQRVMRGRLEGAAAGAAAGTVAGEVVSAHRGSARGVPSRPAQPRSKLGTAAKVTGKIAKAGVAYTVGAPVAVPKATKAAKSALSAKRALVNRRLEIAGGSARGAVDQKVKGAREYAAEYKHNVAATGRFVARGVGAVGATATGTSTRRNVVPTPGTQGSKPSTSRQSPHQQAPGLPQVSQLRANLGQKPMPPRMAQPARRSANPSRNDLIAELAKRRRQAARGTARPN